MKEYVFKPSNLAKKYSKFLDKISPDLNFTGKEKRKLKEAIISGQKYCPELVLDKFRKTAEKSNQNTTKLYNYMILESLKLKFEKQTSFYVLPDITEKGKAIAASTLNGHNQNFKVFKYKAKNNSYTAVGESLDYLKCGINKSGIFITYHKMYTRQEQKGITPGMIMRVVLSKATGMNQAMEILDTFPHADDSAYLVCSADRGAIFQTAGGDKKVLSPQKYFLTLSNHLLSEELKKYDIREKLFPENTSVQRDAHAAYFLIHARRKVDTDTVKRILRHEESGISSTSGDFKTRYSFYYEYGTGNALVTLNAPQESKYEKIKL